MDRAPTAVLTKCSEVRKESKFTGGCYGFTTARADR